MKVEWSILFALACVAFVSAEVCLPSSICHPAAPLCRNCIPGDKCEEPQTQIEGFCAPYIDFASGKPLKRQKRYEMCKNAAFARALPSIRDSVEELLNKEFYKNCIQGEFMCHDGSCQVDSEGCTKRGNVMFFPSNYHNCTSRAEPNKAYWESEASLREANVQAESSKTIAVAPKQLSSSDVVKFCTYFYEVVILGGTKESKISTSYSNFMYSCFRDYEDFSSGAMVQTMNEFYELAGQRAIRNLEIFDARNYPGLPAFV